MKQTVPLVPFYFIRHGETNWNNEHRVMGQKDVPLNQKGMDQATHAAKILQNVQFSLILSSPLIRALKTAKIISDKAQKSIVTIDILKECCLGVREGDIKGGWLEEWKNGSIIENAELYTKFIERAQKAFKEALSYPDPILIVAHNAIYWGIQEALKLPKHDIKNAVPLYHCPPQEPSASWSVCEITEDPYQAS